MFKKWKKKLSALLVVVLLAVTFVPRLSVIADDANVLIGKNGTVYDADYEPNIYDEDEGYYDDDDEDSDVRVLSDYDDATPSDASPSNADKASESNWKIASDSDAARLDIVEFTDAGPMLPATGGIVKRRMLRAAAYTLQSDDDVEGVYTKKTAKKNEDGSYTIQLESFVEGTIKKDTVTTPVDIVLVLDVSGSMDNCIVCGNKVGNNDGDIHYDYNVVGKASDVKGNNGITYYYNNNGDYSEVSYYNNSWYVPTWYGGYKKLDGNTLLYTRGDTEECTKRMTALQSAVGTFINSVSENATAEQVDHRVAIVKFAGKKTSEIGNKTYRDDGYTYNYSQIVSGFTSVADHAEDLKDAVIKFNAGGATSADYGMQHAQTLINGIDESRKSQKVVIMFTDGEPNHGNGFDTNVANNTISASKTMKNDGVTVYTIGVFAGADSSDLTSNTNKYMHYVSSNFKNASSMGNPGTATYPSDGSSYYLSTGSSDGLSDIFDNISQQIQGGGASIAMGKETVVNDVVTPYFDIPKNTSSIQVYTSNCTGKASSGEYTFKDREDTYSDANVSIEPGTNSLSVTGFDYSANFVSEYGRMEDDVSQAGDFFGRKLIIKFTVTPKSGFLGGNNVPTNERATISSEKSGVSETFMVPTVNVPIPNFEVEAADKNVYLNGSLTKEQLIDGASVKTADDVIIDLSKSEENYGLETWQNAFVTITPSADASELSNLKDDTTYQLNVAITPDSDAANGSSGEPAEAKNNTGSGNIAVYLPEITFKDGTVYYGGDKPENEELDSLKQTPIVWKHSIGETTTIASDVTMTGTEPTNITFTYEVDPSKVTDNKIDSKEDVPVTVTGMSVSGSDNLIAKATILREKCNSSESDLEGTANFVLHVKTCELTITKAGGNEDESYVFTVLRNGKPYTYASVTGNDSVTIKELPLGIYTIEEDAGWSWRFTGSMSPENAEFQSSQKVWTQDISNLTGAITCTNTPNNKTKWLNGFSTILKNIYGGTKTERKVSLGE